MRFPTKLLGILGLCVGLIVAVLLISRQGCRAPDTPEGKKADEVIAQDTTWKKTMRDQDAEIQRVRDSLAVSTHEQRRWKDSTRVLLRKDAQDQAELDSTVSAGVPQGKDPAQFWQEQFESQRRIAAQLRIQTIPALQSTIAADSQVIAGLAADTTLLIHQRNEARARVQIVTDALRDLREATKPGIRILGLRLPSWTDDALEIAGTAVLAHRITKAAQD